MVYAIIEASGGQFHVEPGRFYDFNRLKVDEETMAAAGDTYTFDKVLLIADGDEIIIGQPYIEGAVVTGTVQSHLRGRKVIVYKMRPKKKTRKKRGHRQELTRWTVGSIAIGDRVWEAEATPEAPVEVVTETAETPEAVAAE
ncbi:MAG: 50S ribosomal protein L21 [Cyanobacteria bacterium J06641_5]